MTTHQPDTTPFVEPDLTGFLTGHSLMRTQFALLARAAGEVGELDTRRSEALDDHLAFLTRRLLQLRLMYGAEGARTL